jgi:sugar/nucleoside kinase (ribokinase family)
MRIVVAGQTCLDLVPTLPEPPAIDPGALVAVGGLDLRLGGCVANTGTALADLGAEVRLAADVGDDDLGAVLVRLARARFGEGARINVAAGLRTSYSIVIEPPGRDRTFWHHAGASRAFDGTTVDLAGADGLHVGYPPLLPALVADGAAPLRALLHRARGQGALTSVDLVVVDPGLETATVDWAGILGRVAPALDVLSPSADDLASMGLCRAHPSADEVGAVAGRLVEAGVAVVAVSSGAGGLVVRSGGRDRLAGTERLARLAEDWADRELRVAVSAGPVRTTLAAGDAASAGLLFGLLAGLPLDRAAALSMAVAGRRVTGVDPLPPFGTDGAAYDLDGIAVEVRRVG